MSTPLATRTRSTDRCRHPVEFNDLAFVNLGSEFKAREPQQNSAILIKFYSLSLKCSPPLWQPLLLLYTLIWHRIQQIVRQGSIKTFSRSVSWITLLLIAISKMRQRAHWALSSAPRTPTAASTLSKLPLKRTEISSQRVNNFEYTTILRRFDCTLQCWNTPLPGDVTTHVLLALIDHFWSKLMPFIIDS